MEAHFVTRPSGSTPSTNTTAENAQQHKKQPTVRSLQLVVFDIGTLKFAVPIQYTYKVVNCGSIHSSGLNHVGITHLDNLEVTVIDLDQHLFKAKPASRSPAQTVLLIVQNSLGELCGIPIACTPTLMEIPLSMIRVLPTSYRRADTLDIASHVAVIPQKTATLTLFVLDVEQLLPTALKKTTLLQNQPGKDKPLPHPTDDRASEERVVSETLLPSETPAISRQA